MTAGLMKSGKTREKQRGERGGCLKREMKTETREGEIEFLGRKERRLVTAGLEKEENVGRKIEVDG